MITGYRFIDFLLWSMIRFMLYQFILIFTVYNYSDLPKYTLEFKEKMTEFAALSNITYPTFISEQLQNPETIFTVIIGIGFVSGVLATLGVKFFQFISGVFVIILSLVYYHPLKPSTLAPGASYEALDEKYPWIDTILISLFGFGMIFNAFYTWDENIWKAKPEGGEVVLEEDWQEKKNK